LNQAKAVTDKEEYMGLIMLQSQMLLNQLGALLSQLREHSTFDRHGMGMQHHATLLPGM